MILGFKNFKAQAAEIEGRKKKYIGRRGVSSVWELG